MRNVFQSLISFVKNFHQTTIYSPYYRMIIINQDRGPHCHHLKEKQTHSCSLATMKHLKSANQFWIIFYRRGGRRARYRTSQVFSLMSGFHSNSRASGDASEAQSWEDHDPSKHLCHSWCDNIVSANALTLPVLQFRKRDPWPTGKEIWCAKAPHCQLYCHAAYWEKAGNNEKRHFFFLRLTEKKKKSLNTWGRTKI